MPTGKRRRIRPPPPKIKLRSDFVTPNGIRAFESFTIITSKDFLGSRIVNGTRIYTYKL